MHGTVAPIAFAATEVGFMDELHIPKTPFGVSITFKAGLFSANFFTFGEIKGKGLTPKLQLHNVPVFTNTPRYSTLINILSTNINYNISQKYFSIM